MPKVDAVGSAAVELARSAAEAHADPGTVGEHAAGQAHERNAC